MNQNKLLYNIVKIASGAQGATKQKNNNNDNNTPSKTQKAVAYTAGAYTGGGLGGKAAEMVGKGANKVVQHTAEQITPFLDVYELAKIKARRQLMQEYDHTVFHSNRPASATPRPTYKDIQKRTYEIAGRAPRFRVGNFLRKVPNPVGKVLGALFGLYEANNFLTGHNANNKQKQDSTPQ